LCALRRYAGDEPHYEERIVQVAAKGRNASDDEGSDAGGSDDEAGGGGAEAPAQAATTVWQLAPAWDAWAEGEEKSDLDGATRRTYARFCVTLFGIQTAVARLEA
jgi:hypothetical protein